LCLYKIRRSIHGQSRGQQCRSHHHLPAIGRSRTLPKATIPCRSSAGSAITPFLPWTGTRSRQRGEAYDHLKNRLGMQLVRSAERYLPGLSDHLEYVEFATPLSSEYWVNSFQGANFGLEQTPGQFGAGRFYDCTAGIEGLFLVGSGTISGGVLSCMASGVWAASQVLDFLNT